MTNEQVNATPKENKGGSSSKNLQVVEGNPYHRIVTWHTVRPNLNTYSWVDETVKIREAKPLFRFYNGLGNVLLKLLGHTHPLYLLVLNFYNHRLYPFHKSNYTEHLKNQPLKSLQRKASTT